MKRTLRTLLVFAALLAATPVIGYSTGFYDSVEDTAVTNHYTFSGDWIGRVSTIYYSPDHSWSTRHNWPKRGKGHFSSLTTPVFTMPSTAKQLTYWCDVHMNSNLDTCYVEYTTDGGGSWVLLTKFQGPSVWTKHTHDLSAVPNGASVQIRFREYADFTVPWPQLPFWAVDEILVGKAPLVLLSNGQVSPTVGDTSTMYTFSVAYKSPPEVAPTTATMTIDGAPHTLTKVSGVYSLGAVYQYQSKLTAGTHTYSFTFVTEGQTFNYPDTGSLSGPQVGNVIFFDDFESGLTKWVRGHVGGTKDWDTLSGMSVSPTHCIVYYIDNVTANAWFRTANAINLNGFTNVNIAWWEYYGTSPNEGYFHPEISLDGGSSWAPIIPAYTDCNYGWTQRIIDISSYCGSNIMIQYRYTNDIITSYGNWLVDDVRIYATPLGVETQPITDSQNKGLFLLPNFPNPFGRTTEIRYQLAQAEQVNLSVYNINGQLVQTLVNGAKGSGMYSARWDGRDNAGRKAGAGVYLYRLQAGSSVDTRKIVLIR